MADEKAQQPIDESIKKLLLGQVEEVKQAIGKAMESNLVSDTADRNDLDKLSIVLDEIKVRLTTTHPDDDKKEEELLLLPQAQSKREELEELLPEIERALHKCKQPPRQVTESSSEHGAVHTKKMLLAATGCNPFKLRSSSQKKNKEQGGGEGHGEEEEDDEPLSLKLLVRLAKHVLEPEQYYEWTTSYVDESRIYGWETLADEVIESLIGPDEGDFRAAAITGIHGSGKTALAQRVFVHDRAKDNFPIRLWVCVGPPDSEDRFNLLYRMLDNLGLDTNKVEYIIVNDAQVVKEKREKEERRIYSDPATIKELEKKADEIVLKIKEGAGTKKEEEAGGGAKKEEEAVGGAKKEEEAAGGAKKEKEAAGGAKKEEAAGDAKKEEDAASGTKKEEEVAAGGKKEEDAAGSTKKEKEAVGGAKKEEDAKKRKEVLDRLVKEKVENSSAVENSKIGVLLYILHVTLSKTGYLIVFDDIRVYGKDGWYNNLTLSPPLDGEWFGRLAYGLPKKTKHKNAVLLTCRKEDDARAMVRTGRVFRPSPLDEEHGWRLFEREYKQAKDLLIKKQETKKDQEEKDGVKKEETEEEEDKLLKDLKKMKKQIVDKCLGLPVAIIEASKGFACLDPLPPPVEEENVKKTGEAAAAENKPPAVADDKNIWWASNKDM